MPDNVLRAIIKVDAPGAVQTFQAVSDAATKTAASFNKITPPSIDLISEEVQKFQEQLAGLATGSVAQLTKAASILKNELKNLTHEQLNSDFGKAIADTLYQVNARLSELKSQSNLTGSSVDALHRRIINVSNAQHSFARITGELPLLLSGEIGGVRLLGSELFVLASGIKGAKESGQGFGSILGQLVSGLFSVQGLVLIGVGLFSYLAKTLSNTGESAEQARQDIEKLLNLKFESLSQKTKKLSDDLKNQNDLLIEQAKARGATESDVNNIVVDGLRKQSDAYKQLGKDQVRTVENLTGLNLSNIGSLEEARKAVEKIRNEYQGLLALKAQRGIFGILGNAISDKDLKQYEEFIKIGDSIAESFQKAQDAERELTKKLASDYAEAVQNVQKSNREFVQQQDDANLKILTSGNDLEIKRLQQVANNDSLLLGIRENTFREILNLQIKNIQDEENNQLSSLQRREDQVQNEGLLTIESQKSFETQRYAIIKTSENKISALRISSAENLRKLEQKVQDDLLKNVTSPALKSPFQNISLNISDLENVQKNISSIEEQLTNLSKIRTSVGVDLQPEIDKLNEELKLYKQIAAAIPANVPLTLKETTRLADITAIAQQIENALKGLPPVTIPVEVKARLTPKEFANYLTDLNSAFKNIQSVSRQALSGFLETIGNSIGDIVGGKNPFQAIFQFIGGIIEQFGKAIIDLGIVKKGLDIVLKNILTLPAAAIIAIGVGAIAVAEILKNLGNNIPGRALGGPVGAGNTYIVGEKGPEIFVPSVSGTIIPNNQIGNVRAGNFGNFSGEVVFRIGNNELIGTLSKGYKSQSRLV